MPFDSFNSLNHMVAIDVNELRKLWMDGSIKRSGKSELITLFNQRFGFRGNDTFLNCLNGKKDPTPLQLEFLDEVIRKYWVMYN